MKTIKYYLIVNMILPCNKYFENNNGAEVISEYSPFFKIYWYFAVKNYNKLRDDALVFSSHEYFFSE